MQTDHTSHIVCKFGLLNILNANSVCTVYFLTTSYSQCIAIYGEESFRKLYQFLYEARSNGTDEVTIIAGLKKIVDNTRDCFLIDQLIFLEKQHSQWNEGIYCTALVNY